jgi:nucleotide-binding universal stress UspA family protein
MTGARLVGEHREGIQMAAADTGGRIVVGIDGSPSSERALRWAVDRAAVTGQVVEAVIAWNSPLSSGLPVNYGAAQIGAVDWEGNARLVLRESLGQVLSDEEAAQVRTRVVEGHPARVLLDAAAGADQVVVGSRGHGGFAGMLLGSVSQHLIAHAPCPVTVIRDADRPQTSLPG